MFDFVLIDNIIIFMIVLINCLDWLAYFWQPVADVKAEYAVAVEGVEEDGEDVLLQARLLDSTRRM